MVSVFSSARSPTSSKCGLRANETAIFSDRLGIGSAFARSAPKKPSTQHSGHHSDSDIPQGTKAKDALSRPRRPVTFTFSEQYNLTRLTPEEAAALEKKLDEELKGGS